MLKMAILADRRTSHIFHPLGIEVITCSEQEDGAGLLKDAYNRDYGIIFVAESIAQRCMDVIESLSGNKTSPVITIVPDSIGESPQVAEGRLKSLIRRAIGMELLE